jgi:hypothetical protein
MKIASALFLILAAGLLQGCTYPDPPLTEQKDARPAIGVSGAPEGSLLYVDGLHMGFASQYDGTEGVLLVESGSHVIEVKNQEDQTLFKTEIFLSNSATKVIPFNP